MNSITVDQRYFWKASEIVNAVPDGIQIRNVLLLFVTYHTFMNVLGLFGRWWIADYIEYIAIHGENAVVHMVNENTVQQAVVDPFLTSQIVANTYELELFHMLMETDEYDLES